ncbi:ribonuclease D [Afifella marina]|uniref:Ribonuclease D n=1 Tax=Afifella marina DSM 2698 TaxID=1120955 RepID=A0A1G5NI95_AFIMA|nr:ribonuclease D [Afifella marina]MBK1623555.1 ribonuclease D [Afifella marina DSM 2698]MBK1626548.1 ribonuclease D [Afifella marina]MBK5916097.1 ribonuclease D [Afifella marina]RAI21699.1 ribonuclease D [Afifella marina DSM 2698]SCZ37125.1 ribonuclease D [Afifella marina DSM 2698]
MSAKNDYQVITESEQLAEICRRFSASPFVSIDTEFIRETTFWARLCLIQMADPEVAVIVDPLAEGLDLAPFFELMRNEKVTKVFHAARQDVEIFVKLDGAVPQPLFDTQLAAMVCGYGDQISYDQLVYRVTGVRIDKSSRFTDWQRRPLSQKQLDYAVSDVTHLCDVYRFLKANLEEQKRSDWVAEELAVLNDVETYRTHPENAWKRLKMRVRKPRQLAVMQKVAAWREKEAQSRDVPRQRVLKDEAIYEIALQQPRNAEQMARLRALPRGFERSHSAQALIAAVEEALAVPDDELPSIPKPRPAPEHASASAELLKVLLKMVSEEHGVASRLVATVDELEKIAADDHADVPAMKGWRRQLFGERALALKRGEMALLLGNGRVRAVQVDDMQAAAE